jgi:hypothetical protein
MPNRLTIVIVLGLLAGVGFAEPTVDTTNFNLRAEQVDKEYAQDKTKKFGGVSLEYGISDFYKVVTDRSQDFYDEHWDVYMGAFHQTLMYLAGMWSVNAEIGGAKGTWVLYGRGANYHHKVQMMYGMLGVRYDLALKLRQIFFPFVALNYGALQYRDTTRAYAGQYSYPEADAPDARPIKRSKMIGMVKGGLFVALTDVMKTVYDHIDAPFPTAMWAKGGATIGAHIFVDRRADYYDFSDYVLSGGLEFWF